MDFKLESFKDYVLTVYRVCWVVIAILILHVGISRGCKSEDNNYAFRIQRENVELLYNGARADLVKSIDSIIRVCAPTTCMNGLEILKQCERYNVDMFFVLAQGHIESHFGTKGMAAKTNSVFNVMAFDGAKYASISPRGKYEHPDLSIEPYLKLIKNKYLSNNRTELDLMHEFVDINGKRYASAEDYEINLTNLYKYYLDDTRLMQSYKIYNKYKILAGR